MNRRELTITPVADGVTFVEGPLSNWVVLVGEGEVGLIDTGYPAHFDLVLRSIAAAGGDGLPISTALITHGHSDHLGGAAQLMDRFGTTVLASADELPNVRREIVEQIGFGAVLPRLWRPRTAKWVWSAIRAGGLADVRVPDARALPTAPMRVAGHDVVPIATPGHSRGHTAYLLPRADVLATGDALVSAHPTSRTPGAQLLPEMFHADPRGARRALDVIAEIPAGGILPGHGPLLDAAAPSAAWCAKRRSSAKQTVPGPYGGAMPEGPFWM